ncbi:four helix bundle protein [Formosa sp. PL04]|uniref:four helix bundle protein n=1 Tax=Formosa sp. PL04 TaxID=3081755 RepID=UPI0039915DE3
MSRCVVSIPANIAEGCAKDSQKDFVGFLQISLGSAFELETHLIICRELSFIS